MPSYWSGDILAANGFIALNVLGARRQKAARSGYHIVRNSLVITYADEMLVWRFAAVALDRTKAVAPSRLAQELATAQELGRFTIAPVRN